MGGPESAVYAGAENAQLELIEPPNHSFHSSDTSNRSRSEREFFIGNLLVRIHFIIVMMRWTGLAPWEVALKLLFGNAQVAV